MAVVNMHQAKTNLSRLVQRAEAGEDIMIARNGKPVARLTALADEAAFRRTGGFNGEIWIADDFDEEDPQFNEAFYGGPLQPDSRNEA